MRFSAALLFVALTNFASCGISDTIYTETVNGIEWTYTISENAASIGSGSSSQTAVSKETTGNIIIPSTLSGYPVKEVRAFAFDSCSKLTSVAIPNSVERIDAYAFRNCSGLSQVHISDLAAWCGVSFTTGTANPCATAHHLFLNGEEITNLVIPDGVTTIGNYAFYGCSELQSIMVPNSLTNIGYNALYGCSGLTDPLYNPSATILLFVPQTITGNLYVSNSVKHIAYYAVSGCGKLTSITIPEGVRTIGEGAFYGCSGLTSITIPNSVTNIQSHAFYNCSRLTSVMIPKGVTSIGTRTFRGCIGLTSVLIPETVTNIGNYAFEKCTGLKSIRIPDSVTQIGNYAFEKCTGLKSIRIPDSVMRIGTRAFSDCQALENVIIGNGVETLDCFSFSGNTNLVSVVIGCNVTNIADKTFQNCTGLEEVTLSTGLTSIGNGAFYGCSGLATIAIPDSVNKIDGFAFWSCSGMSSISIGIGVTNIGDYAFYNCSGLTSVSITDIEAWCRINFEGPSSNPLYYAHHLFLDNNEVTDIEFSDRLRTIENYAFYGASTLKSVVISSAITHIDASAFLNSGLKALCFPCSYQGDVDNLLLPRGCRIIYGPKRLFVSSLFGSPVPEYGKHYFQEGDDVDCSIDPFVVSQDNPKTGYRCTGWKGTGSVPPNGTGVNAEFTIAEDSSIEWEWETNVWIGVSISGAPETSFESGWKAINNVCTVEIIPTNALYAIRLSGDTDGVVLSGLTLTIQTDQPREIGLAIVEGTRTPALTINSTHGTATPAVGQTEWSWGNVVPASVAEPEPMDGVRWVCTGWTGTGSIPANGAGTNMTFTIQENSTLTWSWQKENQISVSVTGCGECNFGTQWIPDGTTSTATIVPTTRLYSISMSGDTNGVTLAGTTLTIPSDGPRNIAVTVSETKLTLDVTSAHGTAEPTVGTTEWSWGKMVSASVVEPEPTNGWNFDCTGWFGTGSVPEIGTGTNVAFTIDEDSSIVWNWATNVWIDCSATGFASIAFEPCWTNFGETVVIPFEPKDIGFSWTATGDTEGVVVDETARTISIPADRPRTIRFEFSGTTRADAASGGGKPVEWAHGGDAEWFVDFADENDESGFLRSGEIGTSSNSWTEIAVRGPGRLDFDWRVSCNNRGHYAQVLVDDTQWKRITGTTDWTEETIEIGEGEHRIRWNYVKGTTSASGEDRACLDNVVWRPYVNLYVYSYGETNGVPYGSSNHLWGDRIEAQAGPTATYENERYVCSGWECASIAPGSGSETNVAFNIVSNTWLKWNWSRQVWIEIHTKGPIAIPFESGWITQSKIGAWTVETRDQTWMNDRPVTTFTTTRYLDLSATNVVPVEVMAPYASFKLVCEDSPTSANHFPMIENSISTVLIGELSPPACCEFSPTLVDTDGRLVDETIAHRVEFNQFNGRLSFKCTHACRIVLIATEMTLATALDTHGLDWTTSGADVWIPQGVESSDGEDSAKSGTIRGDDASVLRTTLTGPGTLSWKWRLDLAGIAGVDVFLDDAPVDGLYEATDWAERSLQIAGDGEHEIRFEFWNAGDETTLSDCAYLDQVKWTGKLFEGGTETTPESVPYSYFNETYPSLLEAAGGDYEAAAWSNAENGANKVWECYVAGLDPTNPASAFLANIEMKDGEPLISWTPDLGSERVYIVEGKEALGDSEWAIPTNELSQFFRVRVSLDGSPVEPREIFVRFHPNGGTVSPAFGFYESDAADCVFPVPTRIGFVFDGWFTKPEGGERIVSVADAQSSSLSLFAHWSPIHYVITFDANGGTGEMESIEASYGVATTLPPNSFAAPDGYQFQGWAKTANGQTEISDRATVSNLTATAGETVLLFAIWRTPQYCVVDLSNGSEATRYSVSYLADVPERGWTDEYKTTKLVLRRIDAGTFTMGSPENEVGRYSTETQHPVTLTQQFYIGVFELTQKQWELVVGSNPSYYTGDARPVERVSFNDIRGSSAGTEWPATDEVDATSFLGRLRARTGYHWDLPTETQWEYACRAGTMTALNSGKNLLNTDEDSNMAEVGRYRNNGGSKSQHTTVGSYLPNAWGLYDMHGNVWEWCRDWWQSSLGFSAITDPKGASSGLNRVVRGGSWAHDAQGCRSACRIQFDINPSRASASLGFRPSMILPKE